MLAPIRSIDMVAETVVDFKTGINSNAEATCAKYLPLFERLLAKYPGGASVYYCLESMMY